MSSKQVRDSYDSRASEYTTLLGTLEGTEADDRQVIADWAAVVEGPALDAGCGPGHWTAFAREHGADVEGLDLSSEFVDLARERFPHLDFQAGDFADLPYRDGSLGGILSWYSIIHSPPVDVPQILSEFARVLRPDGTLLLGFFDGVRVEPFDHAVVTAWYWPVHEMARELQLAGFEVVEAHSRTVNGARPHGALLARRRAS